MLLFFIGADENAPVGELHDSGGSRTMKSLSYFSENTIGLIK
jgi:hypothetical protein